MNEELIKALKEDSRFQIFQEFVLGEIDSLNSIGDLGNMDTLKAGETARARSLAISILQKIMDPFLTFKEKREPSTEEISKVKARVGL